MRATPSLAKDAPCGEGVGAQMLRGSAGCQRRRTRRGKRPSAVEGFAASGEVDGSAFNLRLAVAVSGTADMPEPGRPQKLARVGLLEA